MGNSTEADLEEIEAKEMEDSERSRSKRPVRYERRAKTIIPQEIQDKFAADGMVVRYKTFRIANVEQSSSISELLRDGWEFVKSNELPDQFRPYYDVEEFRGREEMLIAHDLVLMKHSKEYVDSIQEYWESQTRKELESVDANVLNKKGLITKGSQSKVVMSEPDFAS